MRMPIRRSLVWALAGAVAAIGQPPGDAGKGPPKEKNDPPPAPGANLHPTQTIPFQVTAGQAQAFDAARLAKEAPPDDALRAHVNKFLGDFNTRELDPAKHRKDFLEANVLKPGLGRFGDAVREGIGKQAPDFLWGKYAERTADKTKINVLWTLIEADAGVKGAGGAPAGVPVFLETLGHAAQQKDWVTVVAAIGFRKAKEQGTTNVEDERKAAAALMAWAIRPGAKPFEEEQIPLLGLIGRPHSGANAGNTDIANFLGTAVLDETRAPRVRMLAAIAMAEMKPKAFANPGWNAAVQLQLAGAGFADAIDWLERRKAGDGKNAAENEGKYYAARMAQGLDNLILDHAEGPVRARCEELAAAAKGPILDLYEGKAADTNSLRNWLKDGPAELRLTPSGPILKSTPLPPPKAEK